MLVVQGPSFDRGCIFNDLQYNKCVSNNSMKIHHFPKINVLVCFTFYLETHI